MAGAYPCFRSMHEATQSIATPPPPLGWNNSPSQGYPQQYVAGTHFIHLDREKKSGVNSLV